MIRPMLAVLLLALVAGGCTDPGIEDPNELASAWNRGFVVVPASVTQGEYGCDGDIGEKRTQDCLAAIPANRRVPAVVYIHGCTGPNYNYLRHLSKIGYPAFGPNSFARTGRRKDCEVGPSKHTLVKMRIAEATHALQQLRSLPWIDPDRIHLMGFSEGGMTAAIYPHPGFRSHIVFGWTCTHRREYWLDGIKAPEGTPVLIVWGTPDETVRAGAANDGNCGTRLGDRPQSRFVPIKNGLHDVLGLPEANAALKEFLASQSQ